MDHSIISYWKRLHLAGQPDSGYTIFSTGCQGTAISPQASEKELRQLLALHKSKDLEKALPLAEKLARRFSDHADVNKLHGDILVEAGQHEKAIEAYEKALEVDSENAETLSNLGAAYHAKGNLDKAKASLTRACELAPDNITALNSLGNILSTAGEHEKAIGVLLKAQSLDHRHISTYENLGDVFENFGKYEEAIMARLKTVELSNGNPVALNKLGAAYVHVEKFDLAISAFEQAIAGDPGFAEPHNNLANALVQTGRHEEALKFYDRAISLAPERPQFHNNFGVALISLGNVDKAVREWRTAIKLKPDYLEAHRHLSPHHTYTSEDPLMAQLQAMLAREDLPETDRMRGCFSLAKALTDTGDLQGAFKYYTRANRIDRETRPYSIDTHEALHTAIKSVFTAGYPLPEAVGGELNSRPVFIVGMPRSGTSLVEQILASHSEVRGAGELTQLTELMLSLYQSSGLPQDAGKLKTLENEYRKFLRDLNHGNKQWVVDKMPTNFRWIGFILAAFPDAKVIRVNRNPRAVCWSIFCRYFPAKGMAYSADLEDIARYYLLYEDLMDFWHRRFPGKVYELQYESLTENQEQESRRLIEYLDLPWEDACLDFHKTERWVETASDAQVRQPIYKGSSDAWRSFEDHLAPMLDILGDR